MGRMCRGDEPSGVARDGTRHASPHRARTFTPISVHCALAMQQRSQHVMALSPQPFDAAQQLLHVAHIVAPPRLVTGPRHART